MAVQRTPGQILGSQPAFPSSRVEEHVSAKVAYNEGVTKREIYAALAMQGYLASHRLLAEPDVETHDEFIARRSVESADALCEALAKDGAA